MEGKKRGFRVGSSMEEVESTGKESVTAKETSPPFLFFRGVRVGIGDLDSGVTENPK